jgi:hypothetical protein
MQSSDAGAVHDLILLYWGNDWFNEGLKLCWRGTRLVERVVIYAKGILQSTSTDSNCNFTFQVEDDRFPLLSS